MSSESSNQVETAKEHTWRSRFGVLTIIVPILVGIVTIIFLFYDHLFPKPSQLAIIKMTAQDTRRANVKEFHQLLARMTSELSGRRYEDFHKDAIEFENTVSGRRYDKTWILETDTKGDDFLENLVDAGDDILTRYNYECWQTAARRHATPEACTDEFEGYIHPVIHQLSLALQSREYVLDSKH